MNVKCTHTHTHTHTHNHTDPSKTDTHMSTCYKDKNNKRIKHDNISIRIHGFTRKAYARTRTRTLPTNHVV